MPLALLAHQGGWDEILLVVAPLLVLAVVLRVARRRTDRWQPPPSEQPTEDRDAGGTRPQP